MSNPLLEAAIRQNQRLQQIKQTTENQTEQFQQAAQYDPAVLQGGGLIKSFAGGALQTATGAVQGIYNLGNEIVNPNSTTHLQSQLNDQQKELIERKRAEEKLLDDINKAQSMLVGLQDQNQVNAINQVIKNKQSQLASIGFNEQENQLWNSTGLADYKTRLELADKSKQERDENFAAVKNFLTNDFNNAVQTARKEGQYVDFSADGEGPSLLERIQTNLGTTNTNTFAQGLGNMAPFILGGGIGGTALLGDALRVYDEGVTDARRDNNALTNTGAEQLRALAAAGAYGLLNKAGVDAVTRPFKASNYIARDAAGAAVNTAGNALTRFGAGKLGQVAAGAGIEGVTEGIQEGLEVYAKGRPIDLEAVATGASQGFLTGGAVSAAGAAVSSVRQGKQVLEEANKRKIADPEQRDNFVRNSVKQAWDDNGQIRPEYNPAAAIETLAGDPAKAEAVIKHAEHHANQAQKVLDSLNQAQEVLNDDTATPEQKAEAQEMLNEVSIEQAQKDLQTLQQKLTDAKDVFSRNFTANELNGEKQVATPENILRSPMHYSKLEIEEAIDQTDDQETKNLLRLLAEHRVAENTLKNPSEVFKDITQGNAQYRGLQEYYNKLDIALQTQDKNTYESLLSDLQSFYDSHVQKSSLINEALSKLSTEGDKQVIRNQDGLWEVVPPNTLNKKQRKENGAINVTRSSGKLARQIQQEAALIGEALNAYTKLKPFFDSTITQANRSARNSVITPDIVDGSQTASNTQTGQSNTQTRVQPQNSQKSSSKPSNSSNSSKPAQTGKKYSSNIDEVINTAIASDEKFANNSGRQSILRKVLQKAQGATKAIVPNSTHSIEHITIKNELGTGQATADDVVLIFPMSDIVPSGRTSIDASEGNLAWNPDSVAISQLEPKYQKFNNEVKQAIEAGATIQFPIDYKAYHEQIRKKGTTDTQYRHAFLHALEKYLNSPESGYTKVQDQDGKNLRWVKGETQTNETNQPNEVNQQQQQTTQQSVQKQETKPKTEEAKPATKTEEAPKVQPEPEQRQEQKQEEQEETIEEVEQTTKLTDIQADLIGFKNGVFNRTENVRQLLSAANIKQLVDEELSTTQLSQLKDLRKFVEESNAVLENSIGKPSEYLKDLIKDGKFVNPNIPTAISFAIYESIQRQGTREIPSYEDILKKVIQPLYGEYVSKKTLNTFIDIGIPRNAFINTIGKSALKNLGITVKSDALVTQEEAIAQSLGQLAYHSMIEQGLMKETKLSEREYYEAVLPSLGRRGRAKVLNDLVSTRQNLDKTYPDIDSMDYQSLTTAINQVLNSHPSHTQYIYAYPEVVNHIPAEEGVAEVKENRAGEISRISKENIDKDVLGLILKEDNDNRFPLKEAPSKIKSKIRGTNELAPKEVQEKLLKAAKRPWTVMTDRVQALKKLSETQPDVINILFGLHSERELENLHSDVKTEIALNDRFYKSRMKQIFDWTEAQGDKDFFLNPVIWSNVRSGYENTIMNPQAHKLDRMLMSIKSFKTTVNPTEELFNQDGLLTKHGHYLMGIAEGIDKVLGKVLTNEQKQNYKIYAPDKVKAKDFLPHFVEYIKSEAVQKAITATNKIMEGDTLTQSDKASLKAILEAWDTSEQGVATLMELVNYQKALNEGKEFETYQTRQSDGVTNGPVTSQMLFGLMRNPSLGGLFSDNTVSIQDALSQGTGDLYTELGSEIGEQYNALTTNKLFNKLDGLVSKYLPDISSRSIGKVILTPFNYGAGMLKAINAIASEATSKMENEYYKISTLPKKDQEQAFKDFVSQVVNMVFQYNWLVGIKDFDEHNPEHIKSFVILHNAHPYTEVDELIHVPEDIEDKDLVTFVNNRLDEIGHNRELKNKPPIDAGNAYFRYTKDYRIYNPKKLVDKLTSPSNTLPFEVSNITFALAQFTGGAASKSALQKIYGDFIGVRNTAVQILESATNNYLALRRLYIQKHYGKDETGLTIKEKKEVDAKLHKYRPVVNSSFGVQETIDEALALVKTDSVTLEDKVANSFFNSKGKSKNYSSNLSAKKDIFAGVAPLAALVQSMDAYNSFAVLNDLPAMNFHDANSSALNDVTEMGQIQNKAWLENQMNYNLPLQVYNTLNRVLDGFTELGFEQKEIENIVDTSVLNEIRTPSEQGYYLTFQESTQRKFDVLENLSIVHQYGLEGGEYVITDEVKQQITTAKDKSTKELTEVLDKLRNKADALKNVKAEKAKYTKPTTSITGNKQDTEEATPEEVSEKRTSKYLEGLRNKPLGFYQGLNVNWKRVSEQLSDISVKQGYESFVDMLAKNASNEKVAEYLMQSIVTKKLPLFLQFGVANNAPVNFAVVPANHPALKGRVANLVRIKNTIYVSEDVTQAGYPRVVQAMIENHIDYVLGLASQKGTLSKESYAAYGQLVYIANHISDLNLSNLDNREKAAITALKHGDVSQLITRAFTDPVTQSALSKLSLKNEKENLYSKVMRFLKKLILPHQAKLNTLGELVFNSASMVLVEGYHKQTFDNNRDFSSETIGKQFASKALNNVNRNFVNYLRKEYPEGGYDLSTFSNKLLKALNDNSVSSKEFKKTVEPAIKWLQKLLKDKKGKVIFVDSVSKYDLEENQAIALAEEGSAFFNPANGNVYLTMPEVSPSTALDFTSMLHEVAHAALHSNFPKAFEKLFNEVKTKHGNSPHISVKYSLTNMDEFFANTISDPLIQKVWGEEVMNKFWEALGEPSLQTISETLPAGQLALELPHPPSEALNEEKSLQDVRKELLEQFYEDGRWNAKNTRKVSANAKDALIQAVKRDYGREYKNFAHAVNQILKDPSKPDSVELLVNITKSLGNKVAAHTVNTKVLKSPVNPNRLINTPQEVFNQLYQGETHLIGLMNGVVNPLASLIDDRLLRGDPGIAWYNHIVNGTAFFVSDAYTAGFTFTPAEAFVMETVELTLSQTIDEVVNTPAYRKLYESYRQAKTRLLPKDFHDGDWDTATPTEKHIAQDKWNFIFGTQLSSQKKNDYLTRFLAIGLVHEDVGKLLGFSKEAKQSNSLTEQGTNLINSAVDWLFNRHTEVDDQASIKEKLNTISHELASLYLRNRDNVEEKKSLTDIIAPKAALVEDAALGLAAETLNILKLVPDVRPEHIERIKEDFKNRRLSKVVEQVSEGINALNPNKPIGELRGIFNELVGYDSLKSNEGAKDLFTVTKSLEQARSQQMEAVKKRLNTVFGNKVDKATSKALTNTVLRTDLQALTDGFTNAQVYNFIIDKKARRKAINQLESHIIQTEQKHGNEFLVRAKNTAHYMIFRKALSPMLAKNAYAIVARVGLDTVQAPENINKTLVNDLDKLISLYALENISPRETKLIEELNNFDGFKSLITMQKDAAKLSKAEFKQNPFSYVKGYVPNITNPYKDFVTVEESEISAYEAMGYKLLHELPQDTHDKSGKNLRFAMLNPSANQNRYISGLFSLTSAGKSGTTVVTASEKEFAQTNGVTKASLKKDLITPYKSFYGNPNEVFLIPSYDANGEVISYSYEMMGSQMDAYLDRVNDFREVTASLVGKSAVAQALPNHNEDIVDYLVKVKKDAGTLEQDQFVLVSPTAPTKRGRDLWHLLPHATKDYILTKYGQQQLHVKNNMLDWVWGYQKLQPFALRVEDYTQMNAVQEVTHKLLETFLGKKIKNSVGGIYNAWLEMVKLMKDFVVVRGFTVLFGNILSNMSVLMINGGNPVRAVKDISTALKYSLEYQRDRDRMLQLQWQMKEQGKRSGYLTSELAEIIDKIERNPLKSFIDSGMMPSIVNDINMVNSEFDFKPEWMKKFETLEGKAPSLLKTTMDYLFVNRNTKLHNTMLNVTQQSDFVFRYAMYQQEIRRGTPNKEALRIAKDTYIDYDVPTTRGMQLLNDTGLWMFSKFFMRFQRVLGRLMERHPLALTAEHLVASKILGMPSVWSLGILSRLYEGRNPMRMPLDDVMGMHGHSAPMQIMSAVF